MKFLVKIYHFVLKLRILGKHKFSYNFLLFSFIFPYNVTLAENNIVQNNDTLEEKKKESDDKKKKDVEIEKKNKENNNKNEEDDDYKEEENDPENDDVDQKISKKENEDIKKNEQKKLENDSKIKSLNKAIIYLESENELGDIELKNIKEIIDNQAIKKSSNSKILYYKALLYSKLAKTELAIDNDSISYIKIAIDTYKKIFKISSDKELEKICITNIEELYKRYINRGLKYYKLEYFKRAKNNFDIAKLIKPNSSEVHIYLASILFMQKNYEDALDEYKTYHKLGGQDAASYYGIAIILDEQKQYNKAIEVINQGLEKHQFNNGLIQRRIKILKKLDLLKDYDLNIKRSNLNKGGKYYQLATIYETLGKEDKIKRLLQKAVRYSPKQFETQLAIGIFYYNKASEISEKIFDQNLLGLQKNNNENKIETDKSREKKKDLKFSTSKKRKKKKTSPENQIKKYLKFAKKRLEEANKLKPNQKFIIDKIKYIDDFLYEKKKLKKS